MILSEKRGEIELEVLNVGWYYFKFSSYISVIFANMNNFWEKNSDEQKKKKEIIFPINLLFLLWNFNFCYKKKPISQDFSEHWKGILNLVPEEQKTQVILEHEK